MNGQPQVDATSFDAEGHPLVTAQELARDIGVPAEEVLRLAGEGWFATTRAGDDVLFDPGRVHDTLLECALADDPPIDGVIR